MLADSLFPALAVQAGLDTARFNACRASGRFDKAIQDDRADAMKLGLNATPTFVIGQSQNDGKVTGRVIQGAQPLPQFEAAIAAVVAR